MNTVTQAKKSLNFVKNGPCGLIRYSLVNGRYSFRAWDGERLYCFDMQRAFAERWLTVDEIETVEPPAPRQRVDESLPDYDDGTPDAPESAGVVCVILDRRSMTFLGAA